MCYSKKFEAFPDTQAAEKIQALLVYCPNKDAGCNWIGKLSQVTEHCNDDHLGCLFQEIKCPSECGISLQHKDLENHLINCFCYCQYCKMTGDKVLIANQHKEKCQKFTVQCPNACGVTMLQEEIDEHCKVCLLEEIQCEYYSLGCKGVILRKEREEHNKINLIKHLDLMKHKISDNSAIVKIYGTWLFLFFMIVAFLIFVIMQYSYMEVKYNIMEVEFYEMKNGLNQQLDELKRENIKLRAINASLTKKLKSLESLTKKLKSYKNLTKKLESVEFRLLLCEIETSTILNVREVGDNMLREGMTNLTNNVDEITEELVKLVENGDKQTEELARLAECVDKQTEEIVKLTKNAKKQTEELAENADRQTEELAKLTENAYKRTEEVAKLSESVDGQTEEVAKLSESVDGQTEEVAKLSESVANLTKSFNNLESTMEKSYKNLSITLDLSNKKIISDNWLIHLNILSLLSLHNNQIVPVVLVIFNYSEWVEENDIWYSPFFLDARNGNQFCLSVKPLKAELFVSLHLATHSKKHNLRDGIFVIEVLNLFSDDYHSVGKIHFNKTTSVSKAVSGAKLFEEKIIGNLNHSLLQQQANVTYILRGEVFLRVSFYSDK